MSEAADGDRPLAADSGGPLGAYSDGAARGNPGPASYGVVILDRDGREVRTLSEAIGVTTNNVAEYRGAIAAVEVVKKALGAGIEYRRVEFVGPKVGAELVTAGITAVVHALFAMLVYIWFRFEWQFGIGAVVALTHDVLLTIGIFSLLGFEFNLSTVAAILTIAGYSINDTVVVYDRVRENLRKYKTMTLPDLLNQSLNETLSRTLLTSITTLLALFTLYFLGGEVLKGFSFAMIWGVLVGTYSSIWVATPLLIRMNLRPDVFSGEDEGEGKPAQGST